MISQLRSYLCVELVAVGVPDALQLIVAAVVAAAIVGVVVVETHQVEEEPCEGVGVALIERRIMSLRAEL